MMQNPNDPQDDQRDDFADSTSSGELSGELSDNLSGNRSDEMPYDESFPSVTVGADDANAETDETSAQMLVPEAPRTMSQREFENLTLAQMLGLMRRSPALTLHAVWSVATQRRARPAAARSFAAAGPSLMPAARSLEITPSTRSRRRAFVVDRQTVIAIVLLGFALVLGWWGNRVVTASPSDAFGYSLPTIPVTAGIPFWLAALVLAVIAQIVGGVPAQQPTMAGEARSIVEPLQPLLIPLVLALGLGAFFFNGDNRFSLLGLVAWFGSIIAAVAMFAPRADFFSTAVDKFRHFVSYPRRETATFFTLLLIVGIGTFLRFQYLDVSPPEMTSDHVEKLLDAQQVSNGELHVFMEQNGGREIAQFYLLALIDKLPGVRLDFMALKILAVLEGLVTIPVFWWLGREWIGEREPRLGNLFGLTLALVLALTYWHQELSRIALRIVLTPLVGGLLLIYLVRIMRYNRRADFVKAGLVLGFGLYTYQAVRIMPLLVIAAVVIAVLFNVRRWITLRAYAVNFIALVVVSFVIFVPLFRYSVQYPEAFWSRTSGRLLGPEMIERVNEAGQVIVEQPTLNDRLNALQENLAQLGENMVNALLMFNYRGDVIYLHNVPDYPHLDPLLGAMLITGLGGWLVWLVRRRDPADWLLLPGILIMLLPTALSIALPRENPSTTRASGALPFVMILVAFGAITIVILVQRLISEREALVRRLSTGALALGLFIGVYGYTSWIFAEPYRQTYFQSWHPISTGGRILRGFAESGGAYGNAFILSFAYWWDYRAVAIEAGLVPGTWDNGDMPLAELPQRMADAWTQPGAPRLNPDRDLLFFYHRDDLEAEAQFQQWFPEGYITTVEVTLPPIGTDALDDDAAVRGQRFPDKDFKYYRVPALGIDGLLSFFAETGINVSPP
jgi:Ca2+/Na+ antiporter